MARIHIRSTCDDCFKRTIDDASAAFDGIASCIEGNSELKTERKSLRDLIEGIEVLSDFSEGSVFDDSKSTGATLWLFRHLKRGEITFESALGIVSEAIPLLRDNPLTHNAVEKLVAMELAWWRLKKISRWLDFGPENIQSNLVQPL